MPPWLADGDPVELTIAMLASVLPSRRFPARASEHPGREYWEGVVCHLTSKEFVHEVSESAYDWQAPYQEALARLRDKDQHGSPQSDAVLFALCCFASERGYIGNNDMTDFLIEQKGLPYAVDVMLAAQGVTVEASRSRNRCKLRLSTHIGGQLCPTYWCGPFCPAEWAFRRALSWTDEAIWSECVGRIRRGLPLVPPCRQSLLALILPECPDIANKLALQLAGPQADESVSWLQMVTDDAEAQVAAARVAGNAHFGLTLTSSRMAVATLLKERGSAAVEVLAGDAFREISAEALAQIGMPKSITVLARYASQSKSALANFTRASQRWPNASIPALAELIVKGGRDTGLLSMCLAELLMEHRDKLPTLQSWISPNGQGLIDRLIKQQETPAIVATSDELPRVLTDPPWLAPKRKMRTPLNVPVLTLPPLEKWDDGVRERYLGVSEWQQKQLQTALQDLRTMVRMLGFGPYHYFFETEERATFHEDAAQAIRERDGAALVAIWREYREANISFWYFLDGYVMANLPDDMGLVVWNSLAAESHSNTAYVLAKYGLQALPGLLLTVLQRPGNDLVHVLNFGTIELAPIVARAHRKLKMARDIARSWLFKFPEHAAVGLIPAAIGPEDEMQVCAAVALRLLAEHGHEALIMRVAQRYSDPTVSAALRAVLVEDPLDRFPCRIGKAPEFWQPGHWRRPLLSTGNKALSDTAMEHLGTMLRFPSEAAIYPGIQHVKDVCTPESLADFAWDCFSAWLYAAAPPKDAWAMRVLGLLGNDETARRLTPYLRAWPGESQHARAVAGLDVLSMIESDTALMLLNGIAQKVKFKGLQDKAREKITLIAEARNLTTEELEDRLAPDLGLDDDGNLSLDYGPRRFRIEFDESLKPQVRDGEGRTMPALPLPDPDDDLDKVEAAAEIFAQLKQEAGIVASQQLMRLEMAMCVRRRWTPNLFIHLLVQHPLVRNLVRRLVWGVYMLSDAGNYGGQLRDCFRVTDSGSYVTATEAPFYLPVGEQIRVGLPHTLDLPRDQVALFTQRFAALGTKQPFIQLGRETYALQTDEREAVKLTRWEGLTLSSPRVLDLVKLGWHAGRALDDGCIGYFTKKIAKGQVIRLLLDPGIVMSLMERNPVQTLREIVIGESAHWQQPGASVKLGTLDEIASSELIRDIESLYR
ncbi:DUF4132 domain-containing protein [Chitinimonas arctica]|nr:DUF4132 domain-containing protein [Chitinimonas arctica]